ncbi:Tyrocidine synthase 3 [compost metagenome]
MESAVTLLDVLKGAMKQHSTGVNFIEGDQGETFVTYAEIYRQALDLLGKLQGKGLHAGQELVFQIENNRSFVTMYWASLLGGFIPVPISIGNNDEHRYKIVQIWNKLSSPSLIGEDWAIASLTKYLGDHGMVKLLEEMEPHFYSLDSLNTVTYEPGVIQPCNPEQIAFIQFSSGSTGDPKGVVLTHANLISNTAAIIEGISITDKDSLISWLPLTHDMGLIGSHLTAVRAQINQHLMPTSLFIRHPLLWLKKASKYRTTVTVSPNFGYRYFLNFYKTGAGIDWDLSSIRVIVNGAEPISYPLIVEFTSKLRTHGLSANCIFPVYGLAEASLAVTLPPPGRPVRHFLIDRKHLNIGDQVCLAAAETSGIGLVGTGKPARDVSVRICNENNEPLLDGHIGHIHIKGRNVTQGYYNNPEATKAALAGEDWVKTGDIGAFYEGELIITGRAKDIIFVNGQNIYPHDIERHAEDIFEKITQVAAVGVFSEVSQKEEIILFVHYKKSVESFAELSQHIKQHINQKMSLDVKSVLPVRHIEKTTSGKVQRYKMAERYRNGDFDSIQSELDELLHTRERERVIEQPVTETEGILVRLVQEVLGHEPVSLSDHFFKIGGQSLKAAMLSARIQREMKKSITIRDIFLNPVMSDLANMLDTLPYNEILPFISAESKDFYSMSPAQRRLYILQQLTEDTRYNLPFAMKVEGAIDPDRLEKALLELIHRHESLRTSFHLVNGNTVQRIESNPGFQLVVNRDVQDARQAIRQFIRPFDLTRAPLLRAELAAIADGTMLFLIDFHHIVTDGTSMAVFIQELSLLYQGETLPTPSRQYRDFSEWQARLRQEDSYSESEIYWLESFGGSIPVLDLPTDSPRSNLQLRSGASLPFRLSQERVRELKDLTYEHHSSLYIILLASLMVTLSRWSGKEDLVIGSVTAGRPLAEIESMIGMFVNTIAIRCQPQYKMTFLSFLQEVRQQVLSSFEHQRYPFDELVSKLGLGYDHGRNPLFDVMFSLQPAGLEEIKLGPVCLVPQPVHNGHAKFDLTFEAYESADGLRFDVEYSTELFRPETINRMMSHYFAILSSITQNPTEKLGRLNMLTKQEECRLLDRAVESAAAYPDSTLDKLFELRAGHAPDSIALIDSSSGDLLTYGALNRRSNRLASQLLEYGVTRGSYVGILCERSMDYVIAVLAVLKVGAAFVPLDSEAPAERIHHIVSDASIGVILSQARLVPFGSSIHDLLKQCTQLIIMDNEQGKMHDAPAANPERTHTPSDIAYLIYTSGTTGKPKGTLVSHANVARLFSIPFAGVEITSQDRLIQVSNTVFDGSIIDLFGSLLNGASLLITKKEQILDPTEFASLLSLDVTTAFMTTQLFNTMVEYRLDALKNLRTIMFGGERASLPHVQKALEALGPGRLFNLYGPTETTVLATGYQIDKLIAGQGAIPIGRAVPNSELYVLDQELQLVPEGVNGELYIGGAGVSHGYLNRPDLTGAAFIENPYRPGRLLYRSGDLVRWLPDGELLYLGRADNQIKLRGYRIELQEVESALLRIPYVRECAVIKRDLPNGQAELAAYVVADQPVSIHSLKNALNSYLPSYMVPTSYCQLDRLPLTPQGKLDAKSLPEPEGVDSTVVQSSRNPTEQHIEAIWQRLLNIETISIHSNFFDIGGTSLLVIKMQAEIEFIYPSLIRVVDIFNNPTVARLAELIESRQNGEKNRLVWKTVPWPHSSRTQSAGWQEYKRTNVVVNNAAMNDLDFGKKGVGISKDSLLRSAFVMSLVRIAGEHQSYGLQILQGSFIYPVELGLHEIRSTSGLLQAVTNMENRYVGYQVKDLEGIVPIRSDQELAAILVHHPTSATHALAHHFDLMLTVSEGANLVLQMEFNPRKVSQETSKRFAELYMNSLQWVTQQIGQEVLNHE